MSDRPVPCPKCGGLAACWCDQPKGDLAEALSPADAEVVDETVKQIYTLLEEVPHDHDPTTDCERCLGRIRARANPLLALVVAARAETAGFKERVVEMTITNRGLEYEALTLKGKLKEGTAQYLATVREYQGVIRGHHADFVARTRERDDLVTSGRFLLERYGPESWWADWQDADGSSMEPKIRAFEAALRAAGGQGCSLVGCTLPMPHDHDSVGPHTTKSAR